MAVMTVNENKKNKGVWIFGRYESDSRPPHFPPVIPWIKPAEHDKLQRHIVNCLAGSNAEELAELEAARQELSELDTGGFQTPVARRKMLAAQRKVEELERSTAGVNAGLEEKADRIIGSWNMQRGIREIHMEARAGEPAIRFVTSPIAIRRVVLGTYDFWLHMSHHAPANVFFLKRRDKESWPQGPHPHWGSFGSSGYGCFGTFGPIFERMITRGDWGTIVGVFMQYLAIYYPGSPLIRLNQFKERSHRNEDPLR